MSCELSYRRVPGFYTDTGHIDLPDLGFYCYFEVQKSEIYCNGKVDNINEQRPFDN